MITIPPLLRLLLPLAAGIVAGEVWFYVIAPIVPYLWGMVVLLLAASLWLQRYSRPQTVRWQAHCMWWLVVALGSIFVVSERHTTQYTWSEKAATHRAVVTEVPRRMGKGWRARLRMVDAPYCDKEVELFLVDSTRTLRVGQPVVFHAQLRSLRNLGNPGEIDYATYLRRQGVVGMGVAFSSDWDTLSHTLPLTFRERALQIRESWLEHYDRHFGTHEMAVLSAITLGNRALLDRETRSLYSQTGASHVLALSGLHLAILYYFYQLLVGRLLMRHGFWRWGRRVAPIIGMAWIWSFGFLVGLPTSLVRASLMFTIALAFELWEHRAAGFHRLQLAALVMILLHPYWLFDLGFQLSCVAVAGILLLQPYFPLPKFLVYVPRKERYELGLPFLTPFQERWQSWGRKLYAFLGVSFAAQLATAPLVAYHFHIIPWNGLLASLIVIPAVYLILGGAFLFWAMPFARELFAGFISIVLNGMESSLRLLLHLPFATTTVYPSWRITLLAYVGMVAWAWYLKRGDEEYYFYLHPYFRMKALKKVVIAAVVVVAIDLAIVPSSHPSLRVYNIARGTHLHLTFSDCQSVLLANDTLQVRKALSQSAAKDWAYRDLAVSFQPLGWLSDESGCERLRQRMVSTTAVSVKNTEAHPTVFLAFAPRVVMLGNLRCAVVNERLSFAFPSQPLSVDILLLGEKSIRSLEHTFRFFHPKRLVLSGSLSAYRRRRYGDEAKALGISVFDVSEEGMFEVVVR